MLKPELLAILCCPETHQAVSVASDELVRSLNDRIASGALKNRGGKPVTERMDSGLLREDGKILYAVRNSIPVMLIDEGIPL